MIVHHLFFATSYQPKLAIKHESCSFFPYLLFRRIPTPWPATSSESNFYYSSFVSCFSAGVEDTLLNDKENVAALINNKLTGEFCYVQTRNGKVVSIHYSPTEDEEGINIKRGITGAFQANFKNQETIEETDLGSTHTSHYRYVVKS